MVWHTLLVLLAALALCGCNPAHVVESRHAAADTNREVYQVKGTLKELKPDGKTAVIDHDEIPGYMVRMVMDFEARDKREFFGLKPGDRIGFQLVVTTNDAWIERVHKLAPESVSTVTPVNPTNAAAATFRKSPVVQPLEVGDVVPDYKLTNHLGQPVSLSQFRGKALGITFIFTRCPLPTFCPRMNNNLSAVAQQLSAGSQSPTNWMLLSISFDPEWDTPERLAKYSEQYKPHSKHWQFATSDFWNIDGLTEQLGITFWKSDGTINHNLRTAVFDTRGRLQKVFIGNEWKPEELADEMIKAARVQ